MGTSRSTAAVTTLLAQMHPESPKTEYSLAFWTFDHGLDRIARWSASPTNCWDAPGKWRRAWAGSTRWTGQQAGLGCYMRQNGRGREVDMASGW